jgi:hypothetical protein
LLPTEKDYDQGQLFLLQSVTSKDVGFKIQKLPSPTLISGAGSEILTWVIP